MKVSFVCHFRGQKALSGTAIMLCAALAAVAPYAPAAPELPTPGSALIIGNRHLEAPYAHRDATAFEHFVLDVRRFDPDHILVLRDATEADITNGLKSVSRHESPEVVFYFSGHAVRGLGGGSDLIEFLLANVTKVTTRAVQVFLETSSAGTADRRLGRSLPTGVGSKLTALVAASPNQIALVDERARQGLFTRHFLDALYGWADDNGDGQVTAAEAKAYLDDTMSRYAGRELGETQTASLIGTRDAVLSTVRTGPVFGPPPAPAAPSHERMAVPPVREPTAWAVEAALSLSRAERRLIQQGLASARLDVGPLDGIFGRRTRAAIAQWQAVRAEPPIGYLDAEDAAALLAAGRATSPPERPELLEVPPRPHISPRG